MLSYQAQPATEIQKSSRVLRMCSVLYRTHRVIHRDAPQGFRSIRSAPTKDCRPGMAEVYNRLERRYEFWNFTSYSTSHSFLKFQHKRLASTYVECIDISHQCTATAATSSREVAHALIQSVGTGMLDGILDRSIFFEQLIAHGPRRL